MQVGIEIKQCKVGQIEMLQVQMQMCNVRWDRYFHITVLNIMLETAMQVGIEIAQYKMV